MSLTLVKSAATPSVDTDPAPEGIGTNFDITFPPLPRTVAEVSDLLARQGDIPDTPRLVDVVEADPVVAAAVLRRCNSAYYGLRRRVGNIRQAVFLLGFPEVANIVMAAGLMKLKDVIASPAQVRIFEAIMRASVGAAAYSQEIACQLDLPAKAKSFTVGLLHPVGRLVLLYNLPGAYESLWPEHGPAPTPARERLALRTDALEVGALAAEHWNLPAFFGTVISQYPTPDRIEIHEERTMALVLGSAVAAAEALYTEDGPPLERHGALRALATREHADADAIAEQLRAQSGRIRSYVEAMVAT